MTFGVHPIRLRDRVVLASRHCHSRLRAPVIQIGNGIGEWRMINLFVLRSRGILENEGIDSVRWMELLLLMSATWTMDEVRRCVRALGQGIGD